MSILDNLLAEVIRMRVRAEEAERNARIAAKGLKSLQGQIEAAIVRAPQESAPSDAVE